MTESEVEVAADVEAEAEAEINRLTTELDAIKKQLKEIDIVVAGAANNLKNKKFLANKPVLSLWIFPIACFFCGIKGTR